MVTNLRKNQKTQHLRKENLRFSQVADYGLNLRTEEGATLGVVVQRLELAHEHGATLYPAVEGFHGGFGRAVRMVEQSQFGLAVRTGLKHVERDLNVSKLEPLGASVHTLKIRNIYQCCKQRTVFFCIIKTFQDIGGHRRTFLRRRVLSL